MVSIAQVSNEDRTQQGNFWRNAAGTAIATAGGVGTYYACKGGVKLSLKNWATSMKEQAHKDNSIFKDPALKVLDANNVRYKDFKSPLDLILDDTFWEVQRQRANNPLSKVADMIEALKRKILPEKILDFSRNKIVKKMDDYSTGNNAGALLDKVFVNFDKMSIAAFHEAGHTKNYLSKFGRVLQTLRHPAIQKATIGLAFLGAVLMPKRTKAEEEDLKQKGNLIEKTAYGLKKNCLGIAVAGVLPTVFEEGLASHKGNRMAKPFLTQQAFKTLKSYNLFALSSYLLKAGVLVGSVFVASKIRDNVFAKNQNEVT